MGETQPDWPLLLSIKQLSRLLGRGESTLWADDAAGRLPMPVKIGRSVRWRRDEIEAWVHAGCPPRPKWTWPPAQARTVPRVQAPGAMPRGFRLTNR